MTGPNWADPRPSLPLKYLAEQIRGYVSAPIKWLGWNTEAGIPSTSPAFVDSAIGTASLA